MTGAFSLVFFLNYTEKSGYGNDYLPWLYTVGNNGPLSCMV